ncbi:MAG: DUF2442 domain-containing protein [Ignavibacteriae bacterium HGW-Ignavibacteriae-4]|jgi:hypothetical protein|nr:MAG: DUF2442 domain-containing protein [Ignavibacteriae bacterium HGW-Ignavibacteriae-4]
MNTLIINKSFIANDISFRDNSMVISLTDGRIISVPLEWYPKLRDANKDQLNNWRFIGGGEGIHWEELDEDLLVENFLN